MPARFRETVRVELEELAEELARKVRRLEDEAAVAWLLDGGPAQQRPADLLPSGGRDERIAKYERHLHNPLTSTLHELERLQARRDGEAVPPSAAADWVRLGERAGLPTGPAVRTPHLIIRGLFRMLP